MPSDYFQKNDVVADHFKVQKLLGEGATSQVYLAGDQRTGEQIVLKVLHPHLSTEPESIERFRREFIVGVSLPHSQIARSYELLEVNNTLCIVMEFIPGANLESHLFKIKLQLQETVHIITALLEIIEQCHALGIVHRDIKPKNIIIRPDNTVALLDFGVAHLSSKPDLTCPGAVLGTPEYMAPELFLGQSIDLRCDIYSMGIVLYECLTGSPPFIADTIPELAQMHAEKEPAPIRDTRLCPQWLWNILMKMLAKNPSQRYLCCREVREDLETRRVLLDNKLFVGSGRCFQCNREIIGTIPFCAGCGTWYVDTLKPGEYNVVLRGIFDPQTVIKELRRSFPEALHKQADKLIKKKPCFLLCKADADTGRLVLGMIKHYGVTGDIIRFSKVRWFLKYSVVATIMAYSCVLITTLAIAYSPFSVLLFIITIHLFNYLKTSVQIPILDTVLLVPKSIRATSARDDLIRISRMLKLPLSSAVKDLYYVLFQRLNLIKRGTEHSSNAAALDAVIAGSRKLGEGIVRMRKCLAERGIAESRREQLLFLQERLMNRFVLLVGSVSLLLASDLHADGSRRDNDLKRVLELTKETLIMIEANTSIESSRTWQTKETI